MKESPNKRGKKQNRLLWLLLVLLAVCLAVLLFLYGQQNNYALLQDASSNAEGTTSSEETASQKEETNSRENSSRRSSGTSSRRTSSTAGSRGRGDSIFVSCGIVAGRDGRRNNSDTPCTGNFRFHFFLAVWLFRHAFRFFIHTGGRNASPGTVSLRPYPSVGNRFTISFRPALDGLCQPTILVRCVGRAGHAGYGASSCICGN